MMSIINDIYNSIANQIWAFLIYIVDFIFTLLNLPSWLYDYAIVLVKIAILFVLFLVDLIFIVWLERKLLGRFHNRRSVTETGPAGFLQNIADVLKLLIKEDITPKKADKWIFELAPALLMFVLFIPLAVIPFAPGYWLARLPTSLIFVFAVSTIAPSLVLLAGWASNNKYSMIGGFRAAAQLVAYEVPLALSVLGVIILSGSLDLVEIASVQSNIWFILLQPLGFIAYLISTNVEFERMPFDLPEAESELVVGWRTEYSSIKFGLTMGVEYLHLFVGAALITILYFGGWSGPDFLPPIVWFLLKLHLIIVLFVWIRISFPRARIDQVIRLGWRYLIPLSVLNIIITILIAPYVAPLIRGV